MSSSARNTGLNIKMKRMGHGGPPSGKPTVTGNHALQASPTFTDACCPCSHLARYTSMRPRTPISYNLVINMTWQVLAYARRKSR